MMKKLILVLVLVAALALGCAQEQKPEATPTPTPQATPTPTPQATATPTPKFGGKTEVVIGVIGPMSLPEGTAEKNAAQLAVDEINAQGGILGLPVKLVVGDTKLNPDTATAEFRRLATQENADMITGGFSSGVMSAMMEVMAETKTIFLSDASSPVHPKMVAENYDKYKYWFRVSQNNGSTFALDLAAMIDYLRSKGVEINKVYIIRDEHVWTDPVVAGLTPLLEERGIEIVGDQKVPRGFTEYEQILLDAQDKGADLIMPILAISGTGDVLAKQWAELQIPAILGGHDLAAIDAQFYEKTGGAANYELFLVDGGVLITSPPTEMAAKFIENYKKKYGHYPESHQAYGAYDAVYLYKMAVEAAYKDGEKNPFDPDVVVKYLEKYKPGNPAKLTRNIAFYSNHALVWGDEYVRNFIAQWQDGKQYYLYPSTVANGDLKLPPWI
ncbi:ABC transporter substrate-binding protein [Geoglobus acetivorans]|uniref:ABC transporter substrate-binding protein n=1 Tax=Geoglobus acetivorans TaxID=565033 RepID=A0ABZ3H2W7_GEOAI|nr:ABC transporter substrate-binding protein [Geoglobus acetivorans]